MQKPAGLAHAYNSSAWHVEAGDLEDQGHLPLQGESEASADLRELSQNKTKANPAATENLPLLPSCSARTFTTRWISLSFSKKKKDCFVEQETTLPPWFG